jgi:hypothetical protein
VTEVEGEVRVDPEAIPRRSDGIEARSVGGDLLLYHDGEVAVALNPSAGAIWGLCDGKNSIRGIGLELTSVAKVPLAILLPQIEQVVHELVSAGLLTLDRPRAPDSDSGARS